jgi:hypothetical protein
MTIAWIYIMAVFGFYAGMRSLDPDERPGRVEAALLALAWPTLVAYQAARQY